MEKKRDYTVALLLSFFLGGLGIHRFYTGHIAYGVIQLLTAGGCGIWSLIDFIRICFNSYADAEGQPLDKPNLMLGKIFFFVWVALFLLGVIINGVGVIEAINSVGGGV